VSEKRPDYHKRQFLSVRYDGQDDVRSKIAHMGLHCGVRTLHRDKKKKKGAKCDPTNAG